MDVISSANCNNIIIIAEELIYFVAWFLWSSAMHAYPEHNEYASIGNKKRSKVNAVE